VKRIRTFNEGGKYLTLSYIPGRWLRVFLFGWVFSIGTP
jgi:hypothetical protein